MGAGLSSALCSETKMEHCLIFDLDGTLVDSEPLCNKALLDLLPELDLSIRELTECYRGKKLSWILADIETRLGRALRLDFEKQYRSHVATLFDRDLKPIQGVSDMLDQLPAIQRCIASSGPMRKIEQALEVCGLSNRFTQAFSSYDVGSWKPDPGLLLHAAHEMGFSPRKCIAIDDSLVGIEAAKRAQMTAIHFNGEHRNKDVDCDHSISSMDELPQLIRELTAG